MGNQGDKEEKVKILEAEKKPEKYDDDTVSNPRPKSNLGKPELHEEGPDRLGKWNYTATSKNWSLWQLFACH